MSAGSGYRGVVARYVNGLYDGGLTRADIRDSSSRIGRVLEISKRRLSDLYFAYELVLLEEWHKSVGEG